MSRFEAHWGVLPVPQGVLSPQHCCSRDATAFASSTAAFWRASKAIDLFVNIFIDKPIFNKLREESCFFSSSSFITPGYCYFIANFLLGRNIRTI